MLATTYSHTQKPIKINRLQTAHQVGNRHRTHHKIANIQYDIRTLPPCRALRVGRSGALGCADRSSRMLNLANSTRLHLGAPLTQPISQQDLIESVEEIQRYLSDQVPPLLVADSVEVLFKSPPQWAADGIMRWAAGQFSRGGMTISDLFFHALKKMHRIGELGLMGDQVFAAGIEQLTHELTQRCPQQERAAFVAMLPHLDAVEAQGAPAVSVIHRVGGTGGGTQEPGPATQGHGQGAGGGVPGPPATAGNVADAAANITLPPLPTATTPTTAPPAAAAPLADARVTERLVDRLERFSLILSRLEGANAAVRRRAPAAPQAPTDNASLPGIPQATLGPEVDQQLVATQLISAAAEHAHNNDEMRVYLDQMRQRGFEEVEPENLLRTLSESVPDWTVLTQEGAADTGTGSLETMRRILAFENDPNASLEQLEKTVHLGIEHFNEGALARAVKIVGLALEALDQGQIDAAAVELLLRSAQERLDAQKLRDLPKEVENHPLLSRFLSFFPSYRPQQLLTDLDGEPDRARRYVYLSLLVVHGTSSRQLALQRLVDILDQGGNEESWKYLRNLVYLLRHIATDDEGISEQELQYVFELSNLDQALPQIREVLGYLGAVAHPQTDRLLIQRLQDVEASLAEGPGLHSFEDRQRLLNIIVKGLIQVGTPRALRAAVDHGLKQETHLGDTLGRLADLGSVDLRAVPELAERLLKLLKKGMPSKVLGLLIKKVSQNELDLLQALASTTTPEVVKTFEDIVRNFGNDPIAKAAAEALERQRIATTGQPQPMPFAGAEPSAPISGPKIERSSRPSFAGDMSIFGLPNLLQNLSQSELTGSLTLTDEDDNPRARIDFLSGDLCHCEMGHLQGEMAVYQILETPFPGNFEFREGKQRIHEGPDRWPVTALLMEGMRRYDELQGLRSTIPANAPLYLTGVKPSASPDERDGDFLRQVWSAVKSGQTVADCEHELAADAYRIYGVINHWMEQGALSLEPPAES